MYILFTTTRLIILNFAEHTNMFVDLYMEVCVCVCIYRYVGKEDLSFLLEFPFEAP